MKATATTTEVAQGNKRNRHSNAFVHIAIATVELSEPNKREWKYKLVLWVWVCLVVFALVSAYSCRPFIRLSCCFCFFFHLFPFVYASVYFKPTIKLQYTKIPGIHFYTYWLICCVPLWDICTVYIRICYRIYIMWINMHSQCHYGTYCQSRTDYTFISFSSWTWILSRRQRRKSPQNQFSIYLCSVFVLMFEDINLLLYFMEKCDRKFWFADPPGFSQLVRIYSARPLTRCLLCTNTTWK